jgi:hypothetical protein
MQTSGNMLWLQAICFEFYLDKKEANTTLIGPFWLGFLRAHNISDNDVVTFQFPGFDERDNEIAETDVEIDEYEGEIDEIVFKLTVADANGKRKSFCNLSSINVLYISLLASPIVSCNYKFIFVSLFVYSHVFNYMPGIHNLGALNVPPCIRCILYKTVFTDMQSIGVTDMDILA